MRGQSRHYCEVAARCVAVNAYWITDDLFCKVFGAAPGSVSVTRAKLSVPDVRFRFKSARFEPITGALASTVLVVPLQVYVYGGPPVSLHATLHLSITICRPFVVSVSSSELVVADVVSVMLASAMLPMFLMSTVRWIVSPAA